MKDKVVMRDVDATSSQCMPVVSTEPPQDNAPQSEHDKYWLENVYQADKMPQLTVRALVTGCFIGSIMSFSNLYVGLKTGWGLGASITAAILAYAFFQFFERITKTPADRHFTVLENNTMQTAASAAAYMTSGGLVSAIPALYMVTGQTLTPLQTTLWLIMVSLVGITAAIPVKRKLINEERLKFPSGVACAETLKSLHAAGLEGVAKAKALGWSGLIAALLEVLRNGVSLLPGSVPLFGGKLAKLTLSLDTSMWTIGAGAIMGLRVTISMFLAAVVTFAFAPEWLFSQGFIICGKLAEGATCTFDKIGYRDITGWTLWPGVALMVVHSLTGLAMQLPQMLRGLKKTFASRQRGTNDTVNLLKDVEVPISWFYCGLTVAGVLSVIMQNAIFHIPIAYGILSVVLALGLAFVAARATGETDITPVGAMGKVTQLVFGGILRGQIAPNLMTASVTGGAASQVGDLLTDMKTGHVLGAKPRYQVIAQIAGVLVGSVFATMAYGLLVDPETLGGEEWPAPAAVIWAKVAELLSNGLDSIEPHKLNAMGIASLIGAMLAIVERFTSPRIKRMLPSVAGVGVAVMVPFFYSFSMLLGAVIGWGWNRVSPRTAVAYMVVIASGLIAGETLMGVIVKAVEILAP